MTVIHPLQVSAYPAAADVVDRALLEWVVPVIGEVIHRMRQRTLTKEADDRLRKLELAECLIKHAIPPETRAVYSIFKD